MATRRASRESAAGITAWLGTRPPLRAAFKARVTDFCVSEIDESGVVVELTDKDSVPPSDVPGPNFSSWAEASSLLALDAEIASSISVLGVKMETRRVRFWFPSRGATKSGGSRFILPIRAFWPNLMSHTDKEHIKIVVGSGTGAIQDKQRADAELAGVASEVSSSRASQMEP